jgi:hemolysin activation/secretion protein
VMSSFDGLNYGRLSYQAPIGRATAGVAYSVLNYRLGGPFSSLQATGTAEIASVFASYPLIRSRDSNLTALVDLDDRTFQDKIGSLSSVTDKSAVVLTAGVSGDHRDGFGGGGAMQYAVAWSVGNLDIRTAAARIEDQGGARSNGQYGKLTYSLSRSQAVAGPFSLYAGIRGQVASKNLDISEKMELGGAYGVRAYPEAQIYGDEGYVATLEGRLQLPPPTPLPGRFQLFGFVDTGSAIANKSAWFPGPNRETVSGGGVGVTWADNNNFLAKVTYAHTLGESEGVPGPFASSRVWVQLVKFF